MLRKEAVSTTLSCSYLRPCGVGHAHDGTSRIHYCVSNALEDTSTTDNHTVSMAGGVLQHALISKWIPVSNTMDVDALSSACNTLDSASDTSTFSATDSISSSLDDIVSNMLNSVNTVDGCLVDGVRSAVYWGNSADGNISTMDGNKVDSARSILNGIIDSTSNTMDGGVSTMDGASDDTVGCVISSTVHGASYTTGGICCIEDGAAGDSEQAFHAVAELKPPFGPEDVGKQVSG